jgi:hypothetical protein
MLKFKKFDPEAFLEAEQRSSPEGVKTLAALATLAPPDRKTENYNVESQSTDRGQGKNATETRTPAKPAKLAKATPISNAPFRSLWVDAEDERAAIIEYDGGASRAWAEALARLDPANPPNDVPPKRWLRFIDDCGRFLDEGWADRAVALGWGTLDLFGCNRCKPFARIDHAGLLWLLNGCSLIALSTDTAAIATASGAGLTYRRRPTEPGRVLVWELVC